MLFREMCARRGGGGGISSEYTCGRHKWDKLLLVLFQIEAELCRCMSYNDMV